MRRFVLSTIVTLGLASTASASSCSELKDAERQLKLAATKTAVAAALVAAGAKRDDAENAMNASPDVETARSYALRIVSPLTKKVCLIDERSRA